jgi:hypothetical protein
MNALPYVSRRSSGTSASELFSIVTRVISRSKWASVSAPNTPGSLMKPSSRNRRFCSSPSG